VLNSIKEKYFSIIKFLYVSGCQSQSIFQSSSKNWILNFAEFVKDWCHLVSGGGIQG